MEGQELVRVFRRFPVRLKAALDKELQKRKLTVETDIKNQSCLCGRALSSDFRYITEEDFRIINDIWRNGFWNYEIQSSGSYNGDLIEDRRKYSQKTIALCAFYTQLHNSRYEPGNLARSCFHCIFYSMKEFILHDVFYREDLDLMVLC